MLTSNSRNAVRRPRFQWKWSITAGRACRDNSRLRFVAAARGRIDPVSVFGAVSTTVLPGDLLSGCLVAMASFFMVFEISLEIETRKKGKK